VPLNSRLKFRMYYRGAFQRRREPATAVAFGDASYRQYSGKVDEP
jgi:hypothetical protein